MPSKSPEKYLEESVDKNLRSRHIRIERRPSIRENSPYPDDNDDDNDNDRSSRSPTSKDVKHLYPDLSPIKQQDYNTTNQSENDNSKRERTPEEEIKTGNNKLFMVIIALVAVMLVALSVWPASKSNATLKSQKQPDVDCSQFYNLNFPNQDEKLIKSLKTGIESIYNRDPTKNAVITLFSTDQNMLNNFIFEVVKVARSCINQINEPLNLTNSQLNRERYFDDHTLIINDYKEELSQRKIMIINNIERVSSKIVPSFHAFADTYNPLVAKSLIYITVKVPKKPTGKAFDYIFQHLEETWIDLEPHIRQPLITRLLDQTFFLKPSLSR